MMEKKTLLLVTLRPPSLFDKRNHESKVIISKLKEKFDLNVIWVYYGLYDYDSKSHDFTVIQTSSSNNAFSISSKYTPDLILIHYVLELTNLSFAECAKYLKIPLITCFFDTPYFYNKKDPVYNLGMQLREGISTTSGFNFHYGPKRFHGFYYTLGKYKFLLETLNSIHKNFFYKIKISINFFISRIISAGIITSYIEGDLNLCSSEDWIPVLEKSNFTKSIKIVGNPSTDDLFYKMKSLSNKTQNSDKTRILLVTTAMFEHKLWSKESEVKLIKNTINKILSNPSEFQIDVKIHPAASSFDDYSQILSEFESSIKLFQKEDLSELLQNYDVMITYGGSSAVIYGVLLDKPTIYLLNSELNFEYTDDRSIFYESNVDDLFKTLDLIKSSGIDEEKKANFIKKSLFKFDGKSVERIIAEIINLL